MTKAYEDSVKVQFAALLRPHGAPVSELVVSKKEEEKPKKEFCALLGGTGKSTKKNAP